MDRWMTDLLSSTGYFGIVLLMFIENVFPPIPSEIIMPLAGYIATHGELTLIGLSLAGMAGSVLGALPLYYLGRGLGEARLKTFADRYGHWLGLSARDIERSMTWFEKHGGKAVLFGRLVPGIRSLISIPAGVARMKMSVFLICTVIGSGLWSAMLAYLGYLLGDNFHKIGAFIDPISWVVLGGILVLYIVRILRRPAPRRRKA